MSVEVIATTGAPAPIGTYSQAVKAGRTVYLAGQIGLAPDSSELVSIEVKQQCEQIFKNLAAVCEASGGSLNDIVKLTVLLQHMSDLAVINEVMAQYFNAPYPARAAFAVAALPKGAAVEIEGIMMMPE